MKQLRVDFKKPCGEIKPLHGVNNGPVYKMNGKQRITNIDSWLEAGIPYARTHDSVFYSVYGGAHIVDVDLIFRDFDADPENPASYDFACTDHYLQVIQFGGAKVFYRLGASIEGSVVKKYHTLPPEDFKKWAVICEHIIRHYTEGWADGFSYDIQYWEIWNEPDLDLDDAPDKHAWGGTKKQFFDFYEVVAKHLKNAFPDLKIGGPALAGREEWAAEFLEEMCRRGVPIDFFSWHLYAAEPADITGRAERIGAMLRKNGYGKAESIVSEWNYMRAWFGDAYLYSRRRIKELKGASFSLATMCACQSAPVDLMLYYDARPCGFNGLFSTDIMCDRLKGYYPFRMFNELYKLKNGVQTEADAHLYALAARNETRAALVFTHFSDEDETPPAGVALTVKGLPEGRVRARFYLLDRTHDASFVREDVFVGGAFSANLTVDLFGSYLILFETV